MFSLTTSYQHSSLFHIWESSIFRHEGGKKTGVVLSNSKLLYVHRDDGDTKGDDGATKHAKQFALCLSSPNSARWKKRHGRLSHVAFSIIVEAKAIKSNISPCSCIYSSSQLKTTLIINKLRYWKWWGHFAFIPPWFQASQRFSLLAFL